MNLRNAILLLVISCFGLQNCGNKDTSPSILAEEEAELESLDLGFPVPSKLSEYSLFEEPLSSMLPKEGVEPYELNSPLFTDYAHKKRFIYLPTGGQMVYNDAEVLSFPEGAMIFKFFYYPHDFANPDSSITIVETRVLIFKNEEWYALPYVWNEDQTDAYLSIAGANKEVKWTDESGQAQAINYSVPNMVQCKSCHELNQKMVPIGPSARQLNGDFTYSSGRVNQMIHLNEIGWLSGMPDLSNCPKLPSWEDESLEISQRARAYLEINCGHCHRPEGPAKNSALNLMAYEQNPAAYGVGKTPIAAGRGSGGHKYDIVPGHPESSILHYRMASNEPGVMMPELGRKMPHQEGVEIIAEWIRAMENKRAL